MLLVISCSPSSKASKGGDVKSGANKLSKTEKKMMYAQNERTKEAQLAQLRMVERRIMYFKIRKKEAKKNKQYQQMEIYDMGLKKYQKDRRQMTSLYIRLRRNLNPDF